MQDDLLAEIGDIGGVTEAGDNYAAKAAQLQKKNKKEVIMSKENINKKLKELNSKSRLMSFQLKSWIRLWGGYISKEPVLGL